MGRKQQLITRWWGRTLRWYAELYLRPGRWWRRWRWAGGRWRWRGWISLHDWRCCNENDSNRRRGQSVLDGSLRTNLRHVSQLHWNCKHARTWRDGRGSNLGVVLNNLSVPEIRELATRINLNISSREYGLINQIHIRKLLIIFV